MFLLAAVGFGAVACGGSDPVTGGDEPTPPPTPGDYDITITAKSALGDYYLGSQVTDQSTEFILSISDALLTGEAMNPEIGGEGTLLFLDLYSTTSAAKKGILPNGTYKFIDDKTMPSTKTCSSLNTFVAFADKSGEPIPDSALKVKSGAVVVTSSGSNYTIVVNFVLTDDQTLYCSYTGPITFAEKEYTVSTLEDNYVVPVAGLPGNFVWAPDGYGIGADLWMVQIFPENPGLESEAMQFELAGPMGGTFAEGLPVGVYPIGIPDPYDDTLCSNPGWVGENGTLNGTWYLGGFGATGVTKYAPAKSGDATVTKEGDVYTIAFEYLDDAPKPHTFSGTWTGTPTMIDSTEEQRSSNARVENSFKAVRMNNKFMQF